MKNHLSMRFYALTLSILLISGYVSGQFDWTMVSGNASRTAMVEQEDILAPPLHQLPAIPVYCSHLVMKDGVAYLLNGGTPAVLVAYDLNEGLEKWRFEIEEIAGSIGFVPAISGDIIVVSGQHANGLYGLDRFTGEELWFVAMDSPFGKNPVVDDHGNIFIADQERFLCVNAKNGNLKWEEVRSQGFSTPTLYKDLVLVINDTYINALDTTDGNFVWQIPDIYANRGHMMVEGNIIFIATQDKLCAYENNQLLWGYDYPVDYVPADFNAGSACLTADLVVVSIWNDGNGHGRLVAFDKQTGERKWDFVADTEGISFPCAANGVVYATSYNKTWVVGIDDSNGEMLFHKDDLSIYGHPIIADHKLWIPSIEGVSVFEAKPASLHKLKKNDELIEVYPNPFEENICLRTRDLLRQDLQIELLDVLGQKVIGGVFDSDDNEIHFETNDLKSGVYFLTAQNGHEKVCKKLIKP